MKIWLYNMSNLIERFYDRQEALDYFKKYKIKNGVLVIFGRNGNQTESFAVGSPRFYEYFGIKHKNGVYY